MPLERLIKDRDDARKNRDTFRVGVLSNMIEACQKSTITAAGRVELTEARVMAVLAKYQKMMQETIDTCPAERKDLLDDYTKELLIVKQYAPQLITDEVRITEILNSLKIPLTKENKGEIMKMLKTLYGAQIDVKIANSVLMEILNKPSFTY